MIGKPVSSGGEFPTSLAINKAGTRVCVVNGGKVNGVRCVIISTLEEPVFTFRSQLLQI
jgi:hypothetical protein